MRQYESLGFEHSHAGPKTAAVLIGVLFLFGLTGCYKTADVSVKSPVLSGTNNTMILYFDLDVRPETSLSDFAKIPSATAGAIARGAVEGVTRGDPEAILRLLQDTKPQQPATTNPFAANERERTEADVIADDILGELGVDQ